MFLRAEDFCKGSECCTQRQLQSRLSFSCHFYWHEKTNEEECPDLIREVVRWSTDGSAAAAAAGDPQSCSSLASNAGDTCKHVPVWASGQQSFYMRAHLFRPTLKHVRVCPDLDHKTQPRSDQISFELTHSIEAVRTFANPNPDVRALLSPITANWSGMCH